MDRLSWESSVPQEIARSALWRVQAYRIALFVADIGRPELQRLSRIPFARSAADQLFRALGSIPANICEGYSRGSGPDRVRFYEYALGSALESMTWCFLLRNELRGPFAQQAQLLLAQIRNLLLTMIRPERRVNLGRTPQA